MSKPVDLILKRGKQEEAPGRKDWEMTNQEIDALAVRHVFGVEWDESKCRVCGWSIASVLRPELGCTPGNCSRRPAPKTRADVAPLFTTDPVASKQLRDRMRGGGWMFEFVDSKLIGTDPITYVARFRRWGSGADGKATADTEEMSVALAALATLGVEVK